MKEAFIGTMLVAGVAMAQPATQCVSTALAGGTGDAITVPRLPCVPTTTLLILVISYANTTSTPTLQPSGSSPIPIVNADGSALAPGVLTPGLHTLMSSNGINWYLLNGTATVSGGGIPEAPSGGPYGRGSLTWTPVLPTTGGALTGTVNMETMTAGTVPWSDWLATYAYGTVGTNIIAESTVGGSSITGASRTSTSLGGSSAAIGSMGWGFTDATGTLANMPAWGFYGECRAYPGSTGYCSGMEIDATNLTSNNPVVLPYDAFQASAVGALHLAAGGGCVSSSPCYNPANGSNNLVASNPAAYALLISNNGVGTSNNAGIVFQDQGIYGANGTDSGGGGIAIAMARGHAVNWYATGNLQKFHITSIAGSSDIAGTMEWTNQGLELSNGTSGTPVIFTFNPGPGTGVNGLMFAAGNTGSGPAIEAQGTDANIDIVLQTKGTGTINIGGGARGVSCSGTLSTSFTSNLGIITHC